MAEPTPQTFENHTRYVTVYHFVSAPIFLLNLIWAVYLLVTGFSAHTVIGALFAVAIVIIFLCARDFALKAQDRVIRLEERLRMRELLPDDLQPRINDFTTNQLVALRFASDAELPDLARAVLVEDITSRKAIKERIQTWRPDYQRV
ncbi:MAG: hypothetical protein J4F30_10810 [Acidobacteria bacterium]|nr:hypothetical protein [Acidobacteriota bacterium]